MANTSDISRGLIISLDGSLYTVVEFGENKTACKDCKVHCYQKEMREKVREIMRFSGPRMMIYYPKDFVIHILKKRL